MTSELKRVYRHYEELEEFHAGMWKIIRGEDRKSAIKRAADLMKNASDFQSAMTRALVEWEKSCEVNLTAESVNRIAWLGHAGCCIGVDSPEESTRAAWHTLNKDEQDAANKAAAVVLNIWMGSYQGTQLELFRDA